ncbi:hypothetical protein TWF481_003875 [Arthrobotrys musiformis]|uniref:Geranylgeranyl transferase type-2 subunit beta n=1 Tax=Arthrobotrys musiformis TaxID=47236 RepID=A0AAV9WHW5_9PEZI
MSATTTSSVVFTNKPEELFVEKHVKYIQSLDTRKDEFEYWLTEHLRLNGVYWGLTALHLLHNPTALPRDETIKFVQSCQHPSGGFGAHPNHDAHLLYTLSAIQILATVDALDSVDTAATVTYVAGLQKPSGVFAGDEWGEEDTRFVYTALQTLKILGRLDAVDVERAVGFVLACQNYDGGFGVVPGAESHSGQIFTCLGVLSLTNTLDRLSPASQDQLAGWLAQRQLPNGGLNGRPEKLEDVCYSWWVLSSLAMLGKLHWIDQDKLVGWILSCQDEVRGGFADRKGNAVDVFHTVFALCGLSLVGWGGLGGIDPVYCMPVETTKRLFGSK